MKLEIEDVRTSRIGRREYVVWTAIYIVVFFALWRLLTDFPAPFLLPPLWLYFIVAPRLRDFGWNPLWALSPFMLGVFVSIVSAIEGGLSGGPGLVTAVLRAGTCVFFLAFIPALAIPKSRNVEPATA